MAEVFCKIVVAPLDRKRKGKEIEREVVVVEVGSQKGLLPSPTVQWCASGKARRRLAAFRNTL